MPDPIRLKKLIDLRKAVGKSQEAAAKYLGLAASARNEIRMWEYGVKTPPPKYRELFISYLWEFLELRRDPERFEALWAVLVEQWDWDPLSERERQQYLANPGMDGPQASRSQAEGSDLPGQNELQIDPPDGATGVSDENEPHRRSVLAARRTGFIAFLAILLIAVVIGLSRFGRGFGLPGLPAQASAPAASVGSCYGGAEVYDDQFMHANSWTDWYYTRASTQCADLNILVEDLGCNIWVDAQYYSPSQGTWIDGAHDDVWIPPDNWAVPITNLRNGTLTAVRFYTNCDGNATIKISA